MAHVYAIQSAVIAIDGVVTTIREGDKCDPDDQVVRDNPGMFGTPVEEATAIPGQKRSVRR